MIVTHPNEDPATAAWIDLLDPTEEEAERVHRATGLRVPKESEISEIESTSRLGFENGAFRLSAPLVARRDDGELVLTSVGFVLTSKVLVTVRFASLQTFDAAH